MSSPARSSGEEPLIKTTRKKPSLGQPQTSQSTPVPSLPDDLLLSSFARISRLHYPALSLVSKNFRSLLASPELYETRSLLGRTESCLYVCLYLPLDPNPRWFTLCQKPDRKKEKNSSGNLLAPIAIPNSHVAHWAGVVAVGSSIYAIGGPINDSSPSSDVWVLDCHCLVWRKAPSMHVERVYPAANVVDGKIYVAGGFKDFNSSNWMEVFDPKTQTWDFVVCPLAERCSSMVHKYAVVEGRIFYYTFVNDGVAYKPEEDRWEVIGGRTDLDSGWAWQSYCVIGNVLYSCRISVGIKWYDSKCRYWMDLKGLNGLPKFDGYGCVKLADYGGKLAVLWTESSCSSVDKETRIWCAVIALERCYNYEKEIWGTVEWLDPLLTVPYSCRFECALAATI